MKNVSLISTYVLRLVLWKLQIFYAFSMPSRSSFCKHFHYVLGFQTFPFLLTFH